MKVRLSIAGSTDGVEVDNFAVNQHRTAGAPRRVPIDDAALRSHLRLEEADNERGDTAANTARQWLRCLRCGRGCRKIYGGRYFRCRLCYHLRYASQGESRPDQRALDRARKIAKRLHDRWGGTTEDEYDFPPKPSRMRWATYSRLQEQYDDLENAADARWAVRIMSRFARY